MKTQCGASMLEVIFVIGTSAVLLSMMMTIPISTFNVDTATKQLVSDIRYIRDLAMTSNTRYRINFSGSSYTFSNLDGTTLLTHPVTGGTTMSLPAGVTLAADDSFIVFDNRGQPFVDAAVPGDELDGSSEIVVSNGSYDNTVVISAQTGAVNLDSDID